MRRTQPPATRGRRRAFARGRRGRADRCPAGASATAGRESSARRAGGDPTAPAAEPGPPAPPGRGRRRRRRWPAAADADHVKGFWRAFAKNRLAIVGGAVVLSATRQYSLFDKVTTIFVFVGFATPDFWLALLLMILFGIQLGWRSPRRRRWSS